MMQILRFGGALLALFCIVGCLQVDTVIKINPDGSGTSIETVLYQKQIAAMMGGKGLDEEQFKSKTKSMGEGVEFVSSEKISTDQLEGYKVTYKFSDINKVQINQNPSDKMGGEGEGEGEGEGGEGKKEFIKFHFTKATNDTPAVLIITMPGKDELKPKVDAPPQPPEAMETMKKMFRDMRISVGIEVNGKIIESNATHCEGNKITLMEMDFNKLLENPEQFDKFTKLQPQTMEEAKTIFKDMPGIKMEFNEEVKVQFK